MKKKSNVSMTKKAFVKEHVHLVKVLRAGTSKQQKSEAKEQAAELSRVRRTRK